MRTPRPPVRSPASIFAWPAAILVASLAGLVLGLLGTGIYDAVAWLLLGTPLALLFRRSGPSTP